jgi:hypothetical protein
LDKTPRRYTSPEHEKRIFDTSYSFRNVTTQAEPYSMSSIKECSQ